MRNSTLILTFQSVKVDERVAVRGWSSSKPVNIFCFVTIFTLYFEKTMQPWQKYHCRCSYLFDICFLYIFLTYCRVAEVDSLSARAKMAIKMALQHCYFRDKCVVFACNFKFANIIQYNMQYIPCNNPILAQETLFLTPQKNTFFAQCPSKKKRKLQQIATK